MATKVVFIGNVFGGDDGIGPHLYNELKENPKLKEFELMELGVVGFDLLNYVDDNDNLIIVDALHTEQAEEIGKVVLLGEKDLKPTLSLVSQHDFGIEETALFLRMHKPDLGKIKILGINVYKLQPFADKLSEELAAKLPKIKEDITKSIIELSKK